jgi:hypothetical protein
MPTAIRHYVSEGHKGSLRVLICAGFDRVRYGFEPSNGRGFWPLQLAWFDRLSERGIEVRGEYRHQVEWEARLWTPTGEYRIYLNPDVYGYADISRMVDDGRCPIFVTTD